MDSMTMGEVESIANELRRIIDELHVIASGVGADFTGIGNDNCARAILQAADRYQSVIQQLNKISIVGNGSSDAETLS